MRHSRYLSVVLLVFFLCSSYFVFPAKSLEDTVTLTTTVSESLTMSVSGSEYAFGNLTSGTPKKGLGGIAVDITTSAAAGYNLAVSDGISGNDSALLHQVDLTTRIIDCTATIDSPALWATGVSRGVGITVYAAETSKEVKWGTGTTFDDILNKYAAIPETATTIHNSPGYKEGVDTTNISFIIDVDNSQKTGNYSGDVTLTATAVIS